MSDPKFFDNGLDDLGGNNWENLNYLCLLADGYTFDPTHVFVADIDPGSVEIVNVEYSRANVTGRDTGRVVNNIDHRIEYHSDDPGFGALDPDTTISSMILFRFVSDDSDSPLVACYEFDPPIVTDGSALTPPFPSTGAAYTRSPPP